MYLFSFDYPPNPGGIARLCSEIARALHQRGELGGVLTAKPGWAERPIGSRQVVVSGMRGVQEIQALTFIQAQRQEHVLCGRWWPEAAIVAAARRAAPLVLVHGTELLERAGPADPVRGWLRRRVLERARLVVANSHYTAALVRQIAPTARCCVLLPAVDAERFCPGDQQIARRRWSLPSSARVITTVARVQEHKGHARVLRALAALPRAVREQLIYAVAGKGPALEEMQALARALGVAENVRWLGFVPEEDLPSVYRAADLHALISEQAAGQVEGFGMASLEAQACGTAALGSTSGGIADAIEPGLGGELVPANDPAALIQHLSLLVSDVDRYRVLGAAGRKRVLRQCTWDHYVQGLLQALNDTERPMTASSKSMSPA